MIRRNLWRGTGLSVEDTPEPEVCGRKERKSLVVQGLVAIELSSRASSGKSGIRSETTIRTVAAQRAGRGAAEAR
jgi:hypothetical protein